MTTSKIFKKSLLKYFILSAATIFFISCATKPRIVNFKLTKDECLAIIKDSAGVKKPNNVNLFHTYEETWQSDFWGKKYGSSGRTIVSKITFYKIDGNYVEGKMTVMYDGKLHGNYDVFGRFNSEYLYLFRTGGNIKYYSATPNERFYNANLSNISKYKIGQGSRILHLKEQLRLKLGYTINDANYFWGKPLRLETDLYSYTNKLREVLKSTGFVSSTDDYLGEKKGNKNTQQTITDKLKELKKLLDDKLISKEEYDSLRKKIIN